MSSLLHRIVSHEEDHQRREIEGDDPGGVGDEAASGQTQRILHGRGAAKRNDRENAQDDEVAIDVDASKGGHGGDENKRVTGPAQAKQTATGYEIEGKRVLDEPSDHRDERERKAEGYRRVHSDDGRGPLWIEELLDCGPSKAEREAADEERFAKSAEAPRTYRERGEIESKAWDEYVVSEMECAVLPDRDCVERHDAKTRENTGGPPNQGERDRELENRDVRVTGVELRGENRAAGICRADEVGARGGADQAFFLLGICKPARDDARKAASNGPVEKEAKKNEARKECQNHTESRREDGCDRNRSVVDVRDRAPFHVGRSRRREQSQETNRRPYAPTSVSRRRGPACSASLNVRRQVRTLLHSLVIARCSRNYGFTIRMDVRPTI